SQSKESAGRVRLERAISRFEAAWQQRPNPPLDEHLVGEGPARRDLLVELVHIDLEFRLKQGEAARVEDYLARYPELADDTATVLGLIGTEHNLRRRDPQGVSLDEYLGRFPHYREQLPEALTQEPSTLRGGTNADRPSSPAGWPLIPGYLVLGELGQG